jgi:hypothetical protein
MSVHAAAATVPAEAAVPTAVPTAAATAAAVPAPTTAAVDHPQDPPHIHPTIIFHSHCLILPYPCLSLYHFVIN